MIKYENDCCGCATESYPCDPYCKRKKTPHFYCDHCGEEDALYWLDGKQLCISCVENELESVTDEE
jgi:hypothetical protein